MDDYEQCYIGENRLISMRKNNCCGFNNDNGNEIISPMYEEVRCFCRNW